MLRSVWGMLGWHGPSFTLRLPVTLSSRGDHWLTYSALDSELRPSEWLLTLSLTSKLLSPWEVNSPGLCFTAGEVRLRKSPSSHQGPVRAGSQVQVQIVDSGACALCLGAPGHLHHLSLSSCVPSGLWSNFVPRSLPFSPFPRHA